MTKHEHTSGCMNTYPDCMDIEHKHGGLDHGHACTYSDGHLHPEEVPSPGNEPAFFECLYYANNDKSSCLRAAAPGKLYCVKHYENRRQEFAQPKACSSNECDNATELQVQPCGLGDVELGSDGELGWRP